MDKFNLVSNLTPKGDQQSAINKLVDGINNNKKIQVLLGATGTGKTFTIGNVIAKVNKPTLVLVHNKTLAAQLYAEFKELFPENRVEYFVSNFDFYQPEAYIPSTDTYIDKTAKSNMDIEMMRVSAVSSLLTRRDTIVVCSVAAIYALSDPSEFANLKLDFRINETYERKQVIAALIEAQYTRNDIDLQPGTFKFKGDVLEIAPYDSKEEIVRIEFFDDKIEAINIVDPLTRKSKKSLVMFSLFPAYEHIASRARIGKAIEKIKAECKERISYFESESKPLEAERIANRTYHDMEALEEFGFCSGIENYSMHIDGRKPGQTPYCIFDYFKDKDYLLVVDESHVSLPQIRGMYNGDHARKTSLVDYGFRLPSALENRPLQFDEFEKKINQAIYVSATPGDYELEQTNNEVVEQVIRPTGLLDPIIEVKDSTHQIDDIVKQIRERMEKHERVLITTLTIRMAEDLTNYLKNIGLKVVYMHNEVKTLERTAILYELRKGSYDVLVGINLLREGLDLPEVSLVCILDADKEGFLRSTRSLIQVAGRAARNEHGKVIMYASTITDSMQQAIDETNRRRAIQEKYNKDNNIVPHTIIKEIKEPETISKIQDNLVDNYMKLKDSGKKQISIDKLIASLTKDMKEAASKLDFEQAAKIRDMILELKAEL